MSETGKKGENIRVFVRIRPAKIGYNDHESSRIPFEYNEMENSFILKDKIYKIAGILPPEIKQKDTYSTVNGDSVSSFLNGFNSTIFAYGQTGAGKTFTIFGGNKKTVNYIHSDHESFGLVPRYFTQIYDELNESKNIIKYKLSLSCVEVYNTTLRDLLKPSNSTNLRIRENTTSKNFFVETLTEDYVQNKEELFLYLQTIQLNRSIASTEMNNASSRSHVLLQLKLIQDCVDAASKESHFTFVDLAGSEVVKKTKTTGNQLKEAGFINSSLVVLSRVIEKLGKEKSTHVPFRDSNLTKLLKSSLGGNCKTTVYAHELTYIYIGYIFWFTNIICIYS